MVAKKEKKWYEILASKHFNNISIGESAAYEDKSLIGRIISVNLGNLTRDVKLQNLKIKFIINEVKDGKAYTEVKGYELTNSYIKRIIRAGRDKIDDSFLVVMKDNVKVRIKPLVITKYKTQRSLLGKLRNLVKEEFLLYVKNENYDKLVSELVSKKIQRDLRAKLNKIYPVGLVEVRMMVRI